MFSGLGILALSFIREIPILNANSTNSDQMLCSAASDLGLHCQSPFYGSFNSRINGLKQQLQQQQIIYEPMHNKTDNKTGKPEKQISLYIHPV